MIQVANAPCSWGVLEFEGLEGETADCHRFLRELKQSGYVGTEFGDWGFMPTEADALRDLLTEHELPLLGAFVPVALPYPDRHAEGLATALKTARLLRAVNPDAFIVLADENGTDPVRTMKAGRVESGDGLGASGWDNVAAGANLVARRVYEETGLRTVFHHHCAGWVETPAEVATLLERTDAEVLGLCFDTGHWTFAGGDALTGLRDHRDRIWHVHFKDCDPALAAESRVEGYDYFDSVRRGIFCELGKGCVDFPAVLAALQASGYDDWIVVEQDVLPGMGSPVDSATRNREYLRSIGL